MTFYESLEELATAYRRQRASSLRPFGISLRQYELIALTRRRLGLSLAAAAAELGCDRPTMTVIAGNCLSAGWLARKRSRGDRRSSILALTGSGEELLDRIEAARSSAEAAGGDPLDILDAEERAFLLRTVDRVARRSRDLWGR
jgi:DNA-binding MarR family transcriptional regulator